MLSSSAPSKLVLPFANSGAKNTIPTLSQIGITPGAASLTDGFPPLTRTPVAAGGVPPYGQDMNGILYEVSAIVRWANAGGGYPFDGTFAADSNVGGYPKGARVMRTDGTGYWLNTTDNNTTDPETSGAAAAGWVPDYTNGVSAITMTSANVTLTAAQYGKPIIVISGALTANLNLIFPNIAGQWTVINNTTGAYTVTCKTAAGTGVVVNSAQPVVGDGVNIYSLVIDAAALLGINVQSAGGTADAITATFATNIRALAQIAGIPFWVRAASENTTTTPTFAINGLTAKTIVKGNNMSLAAGDISGAGHWLGMQYDATLDKWVLQNPATGVTDKKIAGDVVQTAYDQRVDYATINANVPYDDTIPQITEGTEIFSVSITPQASANILEFEVLVEGTLSTTTGTVLIGALFKNGGADAIAACFGVSMDQSTAGGAGQLALKFKIAAGGTAAQTYTFRIGANSGSFYLNGNSGGRKLGGVVPAYMQITEKKV